MISVALFALSLCQGQTDWHRTTPDVDLTPWSGNQIWAHCYGGDDGRVWMVWTSGGEVYAQGRDIVTLSPDTALVHVNTTTLLQQDEPQCVRLPDGRIVIAWSDRSSQWTQYMSAQYAVLAPDGTVLVPESQLWALAPSGETSWAPVLDVTKAGGFIAAWTGGWNEYSYAREFGSDLLPVGPEFLLHDDDAFKHDSPDICQVRNGGFVAVHMDGAVASPKDITARWLLSDGTLDGPTATITQSGQQWFPHVSTDRRGIVVCVWDGEPTNDIFLQRWSYTGRPLGHTITLTTGPNSGSNRDAEVEMSDRKGGLAVWEDIANNVVAAQQISRLGQPVGVPFQVNEHDLGDQWPGESGRREPDVWVSPDGQSAIICWTSLADDGVTQDVWAARYER